MAYSLHSRWSEQSCTLGHEEEECLQGLEVVRLGWNIGVRLENEGLLQGYLTKCLKILQRFTQSEVK